MGKKNRKKKGDTTLQDAFNLKSALDQLSGDSGDSLYDEFIKNHSLNENNASAEDASSANSETGSARTIGSIKAAINSDLNTRVDLMESRLKENIAVDGLRNYQALQSEITSLEKSKFDKSLFWKIIPALVTLGLILAYFFYEGIHEKSMNRIDTFEDKIETLDKKVDLLEGNFSKALKKD